MLKKILAYLHEVRDCQRVSIALSKGGAMRQARSIDLTKPATWEFSGFSQNGEDGILDVLRKQLKSSNRYFIEIGTSNGYENNSAWLVVAERYSGIMIEGNPKLVERANRSVLGYSIGAECINMFVTKDNILDLKKNAFHLDPDVFSLDIDGNDYYIAKAILASGFRPKIFVVEYNSVYGSKQSLTVEYRDNFVFTSAHPTQLYYGVSITGWRSFFELNGYKFITVDQNGVNAFFIDPACFDDNFINNVHGCVFSENLYQQKKFRMTSEEQFALISDMKFVTIGQND